MTWGTVTTILAPLDEIERFAAWHLELGAAVVYLYLDDADADKARALNRNPQVKAQPCTDAYWQDTLKMRPKKLQVRQVVNATHAYRLSHDIDWLAHIDGDEFVLPGNGVTVDNALSAVPANVHCARMPMVESLAAPDDSIGGRMYFKACHWHRTTRNAATQRIYGEFADDLNGGFIGHIQGKIFARTRKDDFVFRVHAAAQNGQRLSETNLDDVDLAHFHAPNWEVFRRHLKGRMEQGSYRVDNMNAPQHRVAALVRRSDLFVRLLEEGDDQGIRRLFETVALAQDPLLTNLRAEGLLREHDMPFDQLAAHHFPDQS